MARLKVVEIPRWATPEEVERCIAKFQEYAKKNRVKTVTICGETTDGRFYIASSNTEDKFRTASGLLGHALEMLGFVHRGE